MNISKFIDALKDFGLEPYQRYYSTYPGIVTDNKDPEKRGRILVELPTLLGPKRKHTAWVLPYSNDNAGKQKGSFFPPAIEDHVDIIFLNGDFSSPRYHGGFWAKDEMPADFTKDYPNVKGWVFKSGQKIIVKEIDGKEEIFIFNKGGTYLKLGGAEKNAVLFHESGAKLEIDKDGNIALLDKTAKNSLTIKDGKIDIKANSDVNVTASGSVNIKSTGSAKIEATGDCEVKGTAGTKVGSDASMTEINGTTVQIAKGSMPAAKVGSQAIGMGNLGAPVMVTIMDGSPKVMIP